MPPLKSRLLALLKTQCTIFSHAYNPTGVRCGTSVLRARLRGPSVAAYYPRRVTSMKQYLHSVRRASPDLELETFDEEEEQRLDDLREVKARGKGAPRKKRSAAESKNIKGKGKKQPAAAKSATAGAKFG